MDTLIPLLATIRYYHTNPISLTSIILTGLCIAVAVILSRPKLKHKKWRQWLAVVACQVVLIFIYFDWQWRYPTSEGIASLLICLGFGMGYSLSAMRGRSLVAGVVAVPMSAIFIYLIGSHWLEMLDTVLSENRRGSFLNASPITLLPACITTIWLVSTPRLIPMLRRQAIAEHRASQGYCRSCAYDLRGSQGNDTCPECGLTIEWDKITIADRV